MENEKIIQTKNIHFLFMDEQVYDRKLDELIFYLRDFFYDVVDVSKYRSDNKKVLALFYFKSDPFPAYSILEGPFCFHIKESDLSVNVTFKPSDKVYLPNHSMC